MSLSKHEPVEARVHCASSATSASNLFGASDSGCYMGSGRPVADEALANPVRSGRKQP